jgi:hypothetical protein
MVAASPLRLDPRCTNWPQIHAASERTARNSPTHNTPRPPKCGTVSVSNHTPVASIGKPIATLKCSIHAPGLGRNFNNPGKKLSTT